MTEPAATSEQGRRFAWNGVELRLPASWELTGLGRRDALFGVDGASVAEVKWGPVGRSYDPAKRLPGLFRRKAKAIRAEPAELPREIAGLADALPEHRKQFFRWRLGQRAGVGALLFCPVCRNATLITVYDVPGSDSRPALPAVEGFARLVEGFADHPVGTGEPLTAYAVYDVAFAVPVRFTLHAHTLNPGRYRFEFMAPRTRLTLTRFSLASVLLGRETGPDPLESFGRATFAKEVSRFGLTPGALAAQAERLVRFGQKDGPPLWRRLPALAGLGQPYGVVALKHEAWANRILAVSAAGSRPVDDLAAQVMESYATLPEEIGRAAS